MANLQQLKTKPEMNGLLHDPAAGMLLSAPVLEMVCKKMIEVIVPCKSLESTMPIAEKWAT